MRRPRKKARAMTLEKFFELSEKPRRAPDGKAFVAVARWKNGMQPVFGGIKTMRITPLPFEPPRVDLYGVSGFHRWMYITDIAEIREEGET